MRTYCIARGTLLSALWGPKWEGNPKMREYCVCVCVCVCADAEAETPALWPPDGKS